MAALHLSHTACCQAFSEISLWDINDLSVYRVKYEKIGLNVKLSLVMHLLICAFIINRVSLTKLYSLLSTLINSLQPVMFISKM